MCDLNFSFVHFCQQQPCAVFYVFVKGPYKVFCFVFGDSIEIVQILDFRSIAVAEIGDEFVNVIEQVVGKGATFVRLPAPRTEMAVTYADISKAQALLGYQPKTSLFDGIKAMYEWYVDEYCKQLVVSRE